MIETNTKLDLKMQKALNLKLFIASIVLLIIGIVGLLGYLILSIGFRMDTIWLDILLWVFSISFGYGLIWMLSVIRTNSAVADEQKENNYMFFEDYVLITTYFKGENIGSIKLYYKEIKKIKQTNDYIFLYRSFRIVYPVSKQNLNQQDCETVLSLIKKQSGKKGK